MLILALDWTPCSSNVFDDFQWELSCSPAHLAHGPLPSSKLLCGVTTFLASCRGVKRLWWPAAFPNMKTAHRISSNQPPTSTATCATRVCPRSFLMTCCVTLVRHPAPSLIRGYFIASLQTRLSVLLSSPSSSSSCPSLFSTPPLTVWPTCQCQLDVIPVAWAVLIDVASPQPPLRQPLQLSRSQCLLSHSQ